MRTISPAKAITISPCSEEAVSSLLLQPPQVLLILFRQIGFF